jgi:quercetin dioxygenase-like cupin family protein
MSQTATIVAPGAGPKYWLVGDQLTFKITGDRTAGRYAVAENYITPGGGPPPHVHRREDECFYLIEGTLQFCHADSTFTAGPGTAVYLKKDVPHAFKNVGQTPARFLLFAAPAGFEAFTAEAGELLQSIPCEPREVGPAQIERLLAVCPKHGIELCRDWRPTAPPPTTRPPRRLWVMGHLITLKLTSRDTGGVVSAAEIESRPGLFVPEHLHREQDEMFYVVDGTWEFTLAGHPTRVGPGTFIHIPHGVYHGFRNVGDTLGRLCNYHLPGGFEHFFEEIGVEATDSANPPEFPPPDMAQVVAMFDRHGMDLRV